MEIIGSVPDNRVKYVLVDMRTDATVAVTYALTQISAENAFRAAGKNVDSPHMMIMTDF